MDPRLSYREAAVRGASPVRLVVLLYEQIIEDLREALGAQRQKQVEDRTRRLNHALLVIGQLQGSLNKQHGGRVAENLDLFYNQVRAGLIEAQLRQSEHAIEQQITNLMLVRQAWSEVERSSTPVAAPGTIQSLTPQEDRLPAEWKA
jgi:flagellar secretion chaperone FliS